MTPPRQLSRSTLVLIIFLLLAGAVTYIVLMKAFSEPAPSPATQALSDALAAKSASAASPAHVLAFSRPWLRNTDGTSLFAFTDSEWSALTNAFPDKVLSSALQPHMLKFSEGLVRRVNQSTFENLKRELPASALQTNLVWFFR